MKKTYDKHIIDYLLVGYIGQKKTLKFLQDYEAMKEFLKENKWIEQKARSYSKFKEKD